MLVGSPGVGRAIQERLLEIPDDAGDAGQDVGNNGGDQFGDLPVAGSPPYMPVGQAANRSSWSSRPIRRPIHSMTGVDMLLPRALYLGPSAGVARPR